MSNNNKNYTLMDAKKAEEIVRSNVKKKKKRYCIKIYWSICYFCSFIFLVFLFVSIFAKGIPGFFQHYVTLEVNLDQKRLDLKEICQQILFIVAMLEISFRSSYKK